MKKFFLFAMLSLIIVSCSGSGGGGSSSDSAPTPTPIAPINVDRDVPFVPSDPHNIQEAKNSGLDGTGVTVGVIDTDFDVNNPEFRDSNGVSRLKENTKYVGNGNIHGSLVSEIISGKTIGTAPNVKINAAAAGILCSDGTNRCLNATSEMYQGIYDNGVRIFNQSFGLSGKTVLDFTKADMPLSDPVNNFYSQRATTDTLFIWATGNDRKTDPSVNSGLPYLYPELEKGWIAVTAVDSDTGLISSYANKCGVAQNWCIAAVGDYTFHVQNASGSGTSFATPVITATAALVQQKYPWMNADLIRQTILSTATDKGDQGVDASYGWGLVNISKAVKGPALFDKRLALGDYVNVSFNNVTSSFDNNIAGDAGLIKDGSGTLLLNGTNTYTGNNIVRNGVLKINGTSVSGVAIEPQGALSGDGGYIGANVTNNGGTLINEGSGLTIQGDYIAASGSTIESSTDSTLKVKGKAILNDSNLIIKAPVDSNNNPVYISKNGIKNDIITADKGIENKFNIVNTPAFLQSEVSYTSNKADLTLARKDVAQYVADSPLADATRNNSAQNIEQVFQVLDNSQGNELFRTEAALLQQTSINSLTSVLDSLSGQIYASAQALTFQQSQAVNKDLSNRLVMLGSLENTGDVAGIWFSGIASSGKLSESGYASADTSTYGGQIGIDKSINENLILGVALSYSESEADFDRYGGESKSQNAGVSLYGRYGKKDDSLYVLGRIGAGFVTSDVDREIIVGSQIDNSSINHNDLVLSGYGEVGYKFKVTKNINITPFTGLAYDNVKRGSFSEDDSLFGLKADSKNYDQTSGLIGVRADTQFDWAGGKSTLQGYVSWQKAFDNEDLSFDASYVGMSDEKFEVKGIGLPDDTTWAGIGILTEVNDDWSWSANYDAQFDGSDVANNVFSVGFRFNID